MRRPYLKMLETRFDADEVAVVGRPQVSAGRVVSGTPARYLPGALNFDTRPPPAQRPEVPPPPAYTQAELDAAVGEARASAAAAATEAAREEALREASSGIAAAEAEAMQEVVRQLAALQESFDLTISELRADARTLVLEVVQAVIPRALQRAPLADVEQLLQDLVPRLEAEPNLRLELAPDLLEAGQAALAQIAAESGFRGGIDVIGDPALGPGDARLRWQDGEAERRVADVTAAAIAIAEDWLASREGSPDRPHEKELP